MPGLISTLAGRLRRYVGDRRRAPRRGARFVARLPLSVSPLGEGEDFGAGRGPARRPLAGSTRDLSGGGLTLLLPAARVGDRYLTDASRYLGVRLELPGGPVYMLAAPTRFEQLDGGGEGYAYLLGARVFKMGESDRADYQAYLDTLAREERRAKERRRRGADAPVVASAWTPATPADVAEAFERFLREQRAR